MLLNLESRKRSRPPKNLDRYIVFGHTYPCFIVDSTGVGSAFMDLGCANVLEEQLKHLMLTVDELNQEAIKYNKYQNIALKQCQEKAR